MRFFIMLIALQFYWLYNVVDLLPSLTQNVFFLLSFSPPKIFICSIFCTYNWIIFNFSLYYYIHFSTSLYFCLTAAACWWMGTTYCLLLAHLVYLVMPGCVRAFFNKLNLQIVALGRFSMASSQIRSNSLELNRTTSFAGRDLQVKGMQTPEYNF